MPSEINYNSVILDTSGTATVDESGLHPPHGKTLLMLIFEALYTPKGREMLSLNDPDPSTGDFTPEKRANLVAWFEARGVTDPALVNALLQAHSSAHRWKLKYNQGSTVDTDADMLQLEKVYLQKMAFVTWCLWEDTKGHEFSMAW